MWKEKYEEEMKNLKNAKSVILTTKSEIRDQLLTIKNG